MFVNIILKMKIHIFIKIKLKSNVQNLSFGVLFYYWNVLFWIQGEKYIYFTNIWSKIMPWPLYPRRHYHNLYGNETRALKQILLRKSSYLPSSITKIQVFQISIMKKKTNIFLSFKLFLHFCFTINFFLELAC